MPRESYAYKGLLLNFNFDNKELDTPTGSILVSNGFISNNYLISGSSKSLFSLNKNKVGLRLSANSVVDFGSIFFKETELIKNLSFFF